MIPVFKPILPKAPDLAPYLSEIDANRWYTNYGPLVCRFEARLAAAAGIAADTVVTSSNATAALTQTLLALLGRAVSPGYCLTPSWSFVATAVAAEAAGLRPYFVDINENSWAMTPEAAAEALIRLRQQGRRVAAVLPVAPFGAAPDIAGWAAFQERHGVPVVIDAAASFDAVMGSIKRRGRSAEVPVVVSLHATKAFGVGEGAFILSSDAIQAAKIRTWGNFGFHGSRQSQVPGINAKMPEIIAAVGLATFDQWAEIRAEWSRLRDLFLAVASTQRYLASVPVMTPDWISSYGLVRLSDPTLDIKAVMRRLADRGVETRRWWEAGCHMHPAFEAAGRDPLPVTTRLARAVLGMPFWRGLRKKQVEDSFAILADTVADAACRAETAAAH